MGNYSERHKNDQHYRKAKKEGYRARSAYKLIDIQKKYNIFKRAFYILDLGASPGSWLQVAKEYAEENLYKYDDSYYHRDQFKIMGIDLNRISPIESVKTVKADITSEKTREIIEKYFESKIDLILSDASINKSGNKFSDHIRQIRLCREIFELIKEFLKPGGNFVVKCFQGSDFNKFYKEIKYSFSRVRAYKPKASKKRSNEIYLVGESKK